MTLSVCPSLIKHSRVCAAMLQLLFADSSSTLTTEPHWIICIKLPTAFRSYNISTRSGHRCTTICTTTAISEWVSGGCHCLCSPLSGCLSLAEALLGTVLPSVSMLASPSACHCVSVCLCFWLSRSVTLSVPLTCCASLRLTLSWPHNTQHTEYTTDNTPADRRRCCRI